MSVCLSNSGEIMFSSQLLKCYKIKVLHTLLRI